MKDSIILCEGEGFCQSSHYLLLYPLLLSHYYYLLFPRDEMKLKDTLVYKHLKARNTCRIIAWITK